MILTKAQLLEVLDDMKTKIESGDSLEGSIQYMLPQEGHGETFEVEASYRTNNLQGQGRIKIIQ